MQVDVIKSYGVLADKPKQQLLEITMLQTTVSLYVWLLWK
jgi:hypothetical protein